MEMPTNGPQEFERVVMTLTVPSPARGATGQKPVKNLAEKAPSLPEAQTKTLPFS